MNTLQSVDDDERVYVAQTVINRYIKRVNTYRVLQNVGWSTAVSKTLDSLVLRAIVELTTLGKLKPSYPVYNYTSSQEVVIDVMEISGDMHLVGLMLIGRDRSDVGAAKVGMGIYNSITQERVDGD